MHTKWHIHPSTPFSFRLSFPSTSRFRSTLFISCLYLSISNLAGDLRYIFVYIRSLYCFVLFLLSLQYFYILYSIILRPVAALVILIISLLLLLLLLLLALFLSPDLLYRKLSTEYTPVFLLSLLSLLLLSRRSPDLTFPRRPIVVSLVCVCVCVCVSVCVCVCVCVSLLSLCVRIKRRV